MSAAMTSAKRGPRKKATPGDKLLSKILRQQGCTPAPAKQPQTPPMSATPCSRFARVLLDFRAWLSGQDSAMADVLDDVSCADYETPEASTEGLLLVLECSRPGEAKSIFARFANDFERVLRAEFGMQVQVAWRKA